METEGDAALTKHGKRGDTRGRRVKGAGSFIPPDENEPFTEPGKAKEEKA